MRKIILLLLLTGCIDDQGASTRVCFDKIENIKFNNEVIIDHGFYKDCKAKVKSRKTYSKFNSILNCKDTIIVDIVDGRSFFKECAGK